jgi:lysozyme family protein
VCKTLLGKLSGVFYCLEFMSKFELAIPTIFKHEGLYVNDKSDLGGPTSYGISLRFLKTTGDLNLDGLVDGDIDGDGDIDIDDIKKMKPVDAEKLYRLYWWDKYQYGKIMQQKVATKIFDLAVNMGASQAHKIAQRATWAQYSFRSIQDDGVLGNETLGFINSANPDCMVCCLRAEAANFYRLIIQKNPSLINYEKGWMNRAYE